MRDDMKRVIITPPRYKGWGYNSSQGRKANKDPESLPQKESMRREHIKNWSGKEFSDYLTPLYRFFEKNVNRPWNKVYSEICENADTRSIDGWHLREHVHMALEENVQLGEDGKIYSLNYSYRPYELYNGSFYVHPADGLLKKYKRKDKKQGKKKAKTYKQSKPLVRKPTADKFDETLKNDKQKRKALDTALDT